MPDKRKVFVFGSNLAGRHGKGAALTARQEYGAVYGRGFGRQGHAYAIPTKDKYLRPLPLPTIKFHCEEFVRYATAHADEEFLLTRVGCGLAGYTDREIAPFFRGCPANVEMPEGWRELAK